MWLGYRYFSSCRELYPHLDPCFGPLFARGRRPCPSASRLPRDTLRLQFVNPTSKTQCYMNLSWDVEMGDPEGCGPASTRICEASPTMAYLLCRVCIHVNAWRGISAPSCIKFCADRVPGLLQPCHRPFCGVSGLPFSARMKGWPRMATSRLHNSII